MADQLTLDAPQSADAPQTFQPPAIHASWSLRDCDGFDVYVRGAKHATVQGWITEGALSAITLMSAAQRAMGVEGHVCEIGVHHGRYAIALSLLRKPGEKTVAIDVFEDQELNVDQSGKGDYGVFTKNTNAWLRGGEDLEIMKGDSLLVTPQQIIGRAGGRIRLFSVDGSHTTHHTLNDMHIAEGCVAPGGVVIVDDFLNPAWPGVPEAIFLYLNEPDRPTKLAPIGYGDNKFYLTTKDHAERFGAVMRSVVAPKALRWKAVELGGKQGAFFTLPSPAVVLRTIELETGSDVNLGSDGEASKLLGPGWYGPQREGVWSHGAGGALPLSVMGAPADGGRVTLRLRVNLAIPEGTKDPALELWGNGRLLERAAFSAAEPLRNVDFSIDPGVLGADGRLELWLRNPKPLAPTGAGDKRTLGVFVANVARLT